MRTPRAPLPLLAALWLSPFSHGAFDYAGIEDETVYTGSAALTVAGEAGFTVEAELDGQSLALPVSVTVADVGYHELVLTKRDPGDGSVVETETVQFIIRDAGRGNTEWGLPTWVPRATVAASAGEIAAGELELIAPASFPSGWPLPAVGRIIDPASGKALRLVVDAELAGEPLRLWRGAGGIHLRGSLDSGSLELRAAAASASRAFVSEASPVWTPASGTVASDTTWAAGSRVRVAGDLEIAEGATLTVAAGVIVELAAGAELAVRGGLRVQGSAAAPVVFTAPPGEVWGGCVVDGTVEATFLFITRGGEDTDWFDGSGYSSHRDEQATFLFDTGSTGSFSDCFWIENPGQPLHGRSGTITLDRCLVQRSPTTGQFNGGAVTIRDSHLVEFPIDSPAFADADNDGCYFTTGSHQLIDTVVGWTKDDGSDAGSGSAGTVLIEGCWFESCFHEGMALSGGGREVTIRDTVSINNGQGIECGYSTSSSSPLVDARNTLCIGNAVGWRYGDNYDWDYNGFLTVAGSYSLFNGRDVFGFEWDSWDYRSESMDIASNHLTAADPRWPDNAVWSDADGALLAPFMAVPGRVGVGFATPVFQRPLSDYGSGVGLGLSSFNSVATGVEIEVAAKPAGARERVLSRQSLAFRPGEIAKAVPLPAAPAGELDYLRVSLSAPQGAEISGSRHLVFIDAPGATGEILLPFGSTWRYRDDGTDQGVAWRAAGFDDSGWPSGPAELGYGDGGEATVLDDDPANYPTYYFRRRFTVPAGGGFAAATLTLLRDDGAVVYLDGLEVMRSNMDAGEVAHDDFAAGTVSSESTPVSGALDPVLLTPGEHVIAVEVHQANATSSDVSFDLELSAVPAPEPVLELVPVGGGEALIVWAAPPGSELQESEDLSTWRAVGGLSPAAVGPVAGGRKFYRLGVANP